MGEIVDLRDRKPTSHEGDFSPELVQDLARFAEGLVTEKDIKRRYRFDDATWESLNNDALIAAVEDEKTRRVRSGALKRERAQALVTSAPDVLSGILIDNTANNRHRIDSCKVLNDLANNGPGESTPMADRFQIIIRLDADNSGSEPATLHFNKSIRPLEPGEIDPDDVNDTGMIAAIAAKKTENGGGQESI